MPVSESSSTLTLLRVVRIGLAVLVLIAIGVQFNAGLGRERFDPMNFFSFFTIICNLFGAGVLLLVASGVIRDIHRGDVLRGAATVYLVIVGVVFSLLLSGLDSDLTPWVNAIVHFIMPLAFVLDWCLNPPRTRLSAQSAVAWLVLPVAYVGYTLVRGALVNWYPYPFLNAEAIGYFAVGRYVAAISVFTLVVACGVIIVGNMLGRRKEPARL